jgi:hypothetical protein
MTSETDVYMADYIRASGARGTTANLSPQAIGRGGIVSSRRAQQLDRDADTVGDARRIVDDAARARAHSNADAILPGHDRALEIARGDAILALAEREASFEGRHANRLRRRLDAARAIA